MSDLLKPENETIFILDALRVFKEIAFVARSHVSVFCLSVNGICEDDDMRTSLLGFYWERKTKQFSFLMLSKFLKKSLFLQGSMFLSFVFLLMVAVMIRVLHWWDFTENGKWKHLDESLFQCHFIHHRSTWIDPDSKSGRCVKSPATNRPRHAVEFEEWPLPKCTQKSTSYFTEGKKIVSPNCRFSQCCTRRCLQLVQGT